MADVDKITKKATKHAKRARQDLERVGLDGERLRDLTRQVAGLHDVGKTSLAFQKMIAKQVSVAQHSALDDALSVLHEIPAPGLQGVAEQFASLERDRPGEVSISELRELAEQVAAVREHLADRPGERALARVTQGIERAMLAPAIESARAIEEHSQFVDLDALDEATAYWSASYRALPMELRSKVEAPSVYLTPEQSAEDFDRRARRLMNMSGEEFVRRWEAGEFRDKFDHPDHPEILELVMLLPLAR